MDCSLPGFSVHGLFQARVLEWVAIAFSKEHSEAYVRFWNGVHFYIISSVQFISVAQSCPTLSDPMDCSLPGSSIHGIFQARVLEWGAIAFSGLDGP